MAQPHPRRERVPVAVYLLAANVFLLGTTEFMIVGLLPEIAGEFAVSLPRAGLLISGFAVGLAVGAPLMAVITLRAPRKVVLLWATAAFIGCHVVSLVAPDHGTLVAARVATALVAGASWVASYVLVVRLAPAGLTARSLAVMISGLTLSNIAGVPAGTWLGHEFGWRWAFGAVAIVSAVTALGIALAIPSRFANDGAPPRLRRELRAFRSGGLWLALATTASFQTTMFAALSYLAAMLTDVAGIGAGSVPLVLALFGVGGLIGVTVGGKVADRDLFASLIGGLVALACALTLLALASSSRGAVIVTVATIGVAVAGYSVAPALNARVFVNSAGAPTLAASANMSAFNVGNVLGPWLGGAALAAGWGLVAPVWLAVALALMTLAVATLAWNHDRRTGAHQRVTDNTRESPLPG